MIGTTREKRESGRASGFLTLASVRDVLVILIAVIFSWKLLNSEISIDLSKFGFTDLLALLLALFSIALSVAFYFKATDTSNLFYDNSYKFTKEMSEILGRIEAGFGEKLRHLEADYGGIREKVERLPYSGQITVADVKKDEEEVKKHEAEQKDLFEQLAMRANLAEREKQDLFAKLAEMNAELEQARLELRRHQGVSVLSDEDRRLRSALLEYLTDKIQANIPEIDRDKVPSYAILTRTLQRIRDDLHPNAIHDAQRFGIADESGGLTKDGMFRIRARIRRKLDDLKGPE